MATEQYCRNHEIIFGPNSGRMQKSGSYVLRQGKLVLAEQAARPRIRKQDSKNFRSLALSVHPNQIDKFQKFYAQHGIKGVRFDKKTGDCYIPDRQTKLKILKARGMMDRDEVRG